MSIIIRYKNVFEGKGDQMLYLRSLKSCVFALALLVAGLISASPASAHSVEAQLEEITVKWVEAFKQRDFVTIEGFAA